jgi:hypothetical protein
MFAYYTFKALIWREEHSTFFSPVIFAIWEKIATPWGEIFYLKTAARDLDRGKGIFGASLEEAQKYGQRIYLVAPDPNFRLALGTLGWRAEAAMVVAPVTTEEGAAQQILSAYHAGYPQVVGVLAWAAKYTQPEEGCRILQNIMSNCQDGEVLQVIADSAAAIGEEGLPVLEQLSSSEDIWVRMRVMDACRRPVEYVRPLLQRFVESPAQPVRTYVAYVCSVHGLAALPWLEKLARDDSYLVRLAVARSIKRFGADAIPILEELRHDKEEYVRLEALKSLRAVKKSAKRETEGIKCFLT